MRVFHESARICRELDDRYLAFAIVKQCFTCIHVDYLGKKLAPGEHCTDEDTFSIDTREGSNLKI